MDPGENLKLETLHTHTHTHFSTYENATAYIYYVRSSIAMYENVKMKPINIF
jgi:hypothetical protein